MDDIDLASAIKRMVEDRRELIREIMMDGLLKDIEHYKSLQGELVALNLVDQTIKDFFKDDKRD
jgi:hypothetical protein